VTRDRLPSLVACLESYLANCRRHARSPEFIVADDSRSKEAADATQAALRQLANRFSLRIRYAGRQEKSRFAAALACESRISLEIVRFALFGDERCRLSTGANRNSLLLDAAGETMLMVDDDTECLIAPAPDREEALSFYSGYDPSEFWFFPDRCSAMESVSFADIDVLGCHEPLLGSVAMTMHGLLGDSGMASPRYYLTLSGASRERLVTSPQAYETAMHSREILRTVRRPTISDGPFCMSTFLGLDNRRSLPPFFPVQRNSDGIFGHLLRKCVDGARVAFLPWVLLHAPGPPRKFAPDDLWADTRSMRMADVVIACVLAHEMNGASLGKHLRWLRSLTLSDFEEYIGGVQNFRNFAFLTELHGQLQTHGASPKFWADDVSRMIELLSKPSPPDYLIPRDLRDGRDAEAARRLAQELVGKFGEVLEAWPAMVASAARLRAGGQRMAAAL